MFAKLLFDDPILMLEFCSVLATAFWMLKLMIDSKQETLSAPNSFLGSNINVGNQYRPNWLGSSLKNTVQEHLHKLFDVGELISLPKQSLKSQRLYK